MLNIVTIEKMQLRATRVSPSIKDLSYQDRLHTFGLTTREIRREMSDLFQWFKIKSKIEKVTWFTGLLISFFHSKSKVIVFSLRSTYFRVANYIIQIERSK